MTKTRNAAPADEPNDDLNANGSLDNQQEWFTERKQRHFSFEQGGYGQEFAQGYYEEPATQEGYYDQQQGDQAGYYDQTQAEGFDDQAQSPQNAEQVKAKVAPLLFSDFQPIKVGYVDEDHQHGYDDQAPSSQEGYYDAQEDQGYYFDQKVGRYIRPNPPASDAD